MSWMTGQQRSFFSIYLFIFPCVCELAGLLVDRDRKKKKDEVPEIQEERVPNMALWQEKRSPGASNLVEEHAGLTVYCEFIRC